MIYKELVEILGPDRVHSNIDPVTGIVSVRFRIGNSNFDCQFDSGNKGLYGFTFSDAQASQIIQILLAHEKVLKDASNS